ncbi:MAG: acyl-CoA thioesterase [Candidatus Bipolaricaulota bacterium]|nr:acyl-CoA thioesterase [Candidatus Bipolaricaulota bacterium]MDW8031223.1 thioesterase family protein [Candidatus Bipolaricaulota bacterium]
MSAGKETISGLDGFPVVIELPVQWGEMDAFNHVNNVSYFRYFESARVAYLERIGHLEMMAARGIGPILAAARCEFKRPLTYPDKILVGIRVSEMGVDRFTMQFRIFSQKLQKIAAEGDGVIVSYNYRERRRTPLPDEIRRRIEELEGRTFPLASIPLFGEKQGQE